MLNKNLKASETEYLTMSWSIRPNPEDQLNRKPDDRKNNGRTEYSKNWKTESTVL